MNVEYFPRCYHDQEPEMSQDMGMAGLSQVSAFSLTLADTEGSLSQVSFCRAVPSRNPLTASIGDLLSQHQVHVRIYGTTRLPTLAVKR